MKIYPFVVEHGIDNRFDLNLLTDSYDAIVIFDYERNIIRTAFMDKAVQGLIDRMPAYDEEIIIYNPIGDEKIKIKLEFTDLHYVNDDLYVLDALRRNRERIMP